MDNGKCPDLANILPLAPYFWNGYKINRKYGRYLNQKRCILYFKEIPVFRRMLQGLRGVLV